MDGQYGRTRFEEFTHAQLVEMLAAGRPPEVGASADGWRGVANLLDDIALVLERQSNDFRDYWEGPAANAHATMLAALIDGVKQVAWTARRIGDQLRAAGEALQRAQQRMAALGPPAEPRPPDQALVAAASTPLPYGQARVEAAARQVAAIRAIQDYQRAQAAATAATSAAAAIMDELRNAYLNVEVPLPPAVAEPPTVAPDGSPVFAPPAAGPPPLFAGLWRNGLTAAAGLPPAQLLQPYLPGPGGGTATPPSGVDGGLPPGGVPGGIPTGRAPVPGAGSMPGGGSITDLGSLPGGGGGGIPGGIPGAGGAGAIPGLGDGLGGGLEGGLGGGLSFDPDRAVGQSSAAPSIGPETAAGLANGGAGAAGGAAVPPFLGGFMPPGAAMMGGGGGGFGGGGASAALAWLVSEVEEFGVKSPVVPEVVD